MAYVTQYKSIWDNELNHRVEIELQLKDGPEVEPAEFITTALQINDDSDEGTILARECVLTIWADGETVITWETFLPSTYDTWKIIIRLGDDLQTVFIGFLTPEEGNSPFLDKPYEVTIRATNGLKLLKDAPLKKLDGTNFKGKFHIVDYVLAALGQNLLNDIPLRIYGSIYESSMLDRDDDITKDWYNQARLDHRRFLKDPTTFESCYQSLLIILKRHSRLFFWKGMFVIFYMPEHQYRPGGLYYTQYDPDGTITTGEIEAEGPGKVGKSELIYPINETAIIAAHFGIKTASTSFMYDVWPEIPLNNKFERGELILLLSGIGYRSFSIEDWRYGKFTSGNAAFPFLATTDTAYRKSSFDAFNIETDREIVLPNTSGTANYLLSEGIPVSAQDKMNLEFDFRDPGGGDGAGVIPLARAYLYPLGNTNDPYWLDNNGKWNTSTVASLNHNYASGDDSSIYQSFRFEAQKFPEDGTLYIMLHNPNSPSTRYYRNFNLEYIPFTAGGYQQVKGDRWTHSQNANMIDVDSDEIFISDSKLKVAKGELWRDNGTEITTPTWYRQGTQEARHFKELVNLWRFNLAYRRFYKIEGDFTGLFYDPKEDQLNKQLISWHKEYQFSDIDPQRQFILIPPLQMDIVTGNIHAEFQEVLNPATSNTTTETIDQVIARLIGEINSTTADEWNDAAAAPTPGTTGFPPTAAVYPYQDRSITVVLNSADNATASADANGEGNSPSIAETYNAEVSPGIRWQIFQLGADLVAGNKYTITIYGVSVTVTVKEITTYQDGTQTGDSQVFNYIF